MENPNLAAMIIIITTIDICLLLLSLLLLPSLLILLILLLVLVLYRFRAKVIAPIIFCTMVPGICHVGSASKVGGVAVKAGR